MGQLSRDTYRRLTLLGALGEFRDGAFGLKRLHKMLYIATKDLRRKPFTFVKHRYGQFSEDLDETKDLVLALGYVKAFPLSRKVEGGTWSTVEGNKYVIRNVRLRTYFKEALGEADPDSEKALARTIDRYGYLTERELMDYVYSLPEFQTVPDYGVFFESNLPELVDVGISETECGYLEDILDPAFSPKKSVLQAEDLPDEQVKENRWRAMHDLARSLRGKDAHWSGVVRDFRTVPPA